jgi:hypothetical protein
LPDSPWACLYKDNPLYKETSALLMAAYLGARPCDIVLSGKDGGGYWRIDVITCTP